MEGAGTAMAPAALELNPLMNPVRTSTASLCQQLPRVFPSMAILEQHKRESCYLRDMALTVEQNYSESDHEATLNFQSARDDIKNKARGGSSKEPFGAGEQSTQ